MFMCLIHLFFGVNCTLWPERTESSAGDFYQSCILKDNTETLRMTPVLALLPTSQCENQPLPCKVGLNLSFHWKLSGYNSHLYRGILEAILSCLKDYVISLLTKFSVLVKEVTSGYC